jgi:hypothetical protein
MSDVENLLPSYADVIENIRRKQPKITNCFCQSLLGGK